MHTAFQVDVAAKGRARSCRFRVDAEGISPVASDEGDVDFVLSIPEAELAAVAEGGLRLDEGYMQGRVKVTGNLGRLLSVLPVLLTDEATSRIVTACERSPEA